MPGVPFLYYGDEIGMRYLYNLPTREGGYSRTGSRTPMQWNSGSNMGFSTASSDHLYLPVDTGTCAPDAASQEKDPSSLLNTVKALLRLRRSEEDLGSKPNLEVLHPSGKTDSTDRSFIYRRGAFIIAVNPGANTVQVPAAADKTPALAYSIGCCIFENGYIKLEPQSFGVWKA